MGSRRRGREKGRRGEGQKGRRTEGEDDRRIEGKREGGKEKILEERTYSLRRSTEHGQAGSENEKRCGGRGWGRAWNPGWESKSRNLKERTGGVGHEFEQSGEDRRLAPMLITTLRGSGRAIAMTWVWAKARTARLRMEESCIFDVGNDCLVCVGRLGAVSALQMMIS